MKRLLLLIGVLAFIALNVVLVYFTFNPARFVPLIASTSAGKDQVYYVGNEPYALGSVYTKRDNELYIFVGKLRDVYVSKNIVYAKIQLKENSSQTITAQVDLPNTKVSIVDHPIDYLFDVFEQSHVQIVSNPQQIIAHLSIYKRQNLAFFAPLPTSKILPTTLDPKTAAYRKRPDIIALGKLQDQALSCNTQLLTILRQKQSPSLSCTPYLPEIHINTGRWKPL